MSIFNNVVHATHTGDIDYPVTYLNFCSRLKVSLCMFRQLDDMLSEHGNLISDDCFAFFDMLYGAYEETTELAIKFNDFFDSLSPSETILPKQQHKQAQ